MHRRTNRLIGLLALLMILGACTNTGPPSSDKSPIVAEQIEIAISTASSTVTPGETISLHIVTETENVEFTDITWNAVDGEFSQQDDVTVLWQAPWTAGEYLLTVIATVDGEIISAQVTMTVAGDAQVLGVEITAAETTAPTGGKLLLGALIHGPDSETATIEWSEDGLHNGSFSEPNQQDITWNAPDQPSTNEITVAVTVGEDTVSATVIIETVNHLDLTALSPTLISTSVGSVVELTVEASGYYATEADVEWQFDHQDALSGHVRVEELDRFTIVYQPLRESSSSHEVSITATTASGVAKSMSFTVEVGFCDAGDFSTATTPCALSNIYQIQAIGADADRLAGYYRLSNDIDASETAEWNDGTGFLPIGSNPDDYSDYSHFSGEFDGSGREIFGLQINEPLREAVGLFSHIDGVVKNFTIRGAYVAGDFLVGTVAGVQSGGHVSNVHVRESEILGSVGAGGFIAWLADAGNAVSDASVKGLNVTAEGFAAGGMFALIEASEVSDVLIGATDVFAKDRIAGGLAGGLAPRGKILRGTVLNTNVKTDGESAGGFVGTAEESAQVTDSYVFGPTSHVSGASNVGGFVGQNLGIIKTSYAVINVSGTEEAIGGFVGEMDHSRSEIDQAFAYGEVSGPVSAVGGFVGVVLPDANQRIQVALWSPEISGQSNSAAGIMLNSDAEFMDFSVLEGHGFAMSGATRAWRLPLSTEEHAFVPDLRNNAR